jgi:hypothetical protein
MAIIFIKNRPPCSEPELRWLIGVGKNATVQYFTIGTVLLLEEPSERPGRLAAAPQVFSG